MKPRTAVVIGSGPGGLSAALHLARFGFEVTVLEQAKQLGGFINPFVRSKYEFDPGLHYMGDCAPGRPTAYYFEELGIDARDIFCELAPDGFDRYQFPDLEVAMCRGLEAYRDRLAGFFPAERQNLARFFEAVRGFQVFTDVMTNVLSRRRLAFRDYLRLLSGYKVARFARSTYGIMLKSYFRDPHLMAVLAGNCGDYGLPPGKVSALYALTIFGHFLNGAYFPRGGGRALRDRLVSLATERGAKFLRRQSVSRLVLKSGRVAAVETEAGDTYTPDLVVSTIDPVVTFGTLIGEAQLPMMTRRKVRRNQPSVATFCLYIGMKRDLSQHGLGRFNLWHYPSWDIDATFEPLHQGEMWHEPPLFFSANSLKDDSNALAPAGGSTLDIMTFAPYEHFAPWEEQKPYKREADYTDVKQRYTDYLLSYIAQVFPDLIGDVVVCEASTPITNRHYVASNRGGIYGPAPVPDQSVIFRQGVRTFVPNLFLAGGGVIYGSGVAPALFSGRLAARLAMESVGG